MKKSLLLSCVLSAFICTAFAQKSEVFVTNGKAIKGYDAVAFFTDGKPVKGSDQFAFEWKDATWLFASRAHLDSFAINPEKYAPQYGGYCAFGAAEGHKAPTETDTWTVIDNKLYFNYNKQVKNTWIKNTPHYIMSADKNWITLKDKE